MPFLANFIMEDLAFDDHEEEGYDQEVINMDINLEGRLVEVRGMAGRTARIAWEQLWPEAKEVKEAEVEGLHGLCVQWLEDSEEYVVQTFDGLTAIVPQDCVEEVSPTLPEDGGFDLVWSEGGDPDFGLLMVEALDRRGYCVVQLSIAAAVRQAAAMRAQELDDYVQLRTETELHYMGRDNCTRLKSCPADLPDQDPEDALQFCDRYLSDVAAAVCSTSTDAWGYQLVGRTPSFARLDSALAPKPFSLQEIEDGQVEAFFDFVKSRKVCMILLLENSGGHISLYPEGEEIRIPLSRGKLLLFRHDKMSYCYQPHGNHLAIQAWLIGGMLGIELQRLEGTQKEYSEILEITGPWQPEGQQANITALMVRMPGRSWGYYAYWNMFAAGTDCVQEWNNMRWDPDLYYEPDRDKAMFSGMSYMHHGGFLDETEFNNFDNQFFNISDEEANCMYPGQRIVMEVGYEALWRAGYSQQDCLGQHIGVHLGDVGPDWHSVKNAWPLGMSPGSDFDLKNLGSTAGITSTRLSHFLGLVGPINSVATACSSSLVALNIAHHNIINQREDVARKTANKALDERHLVIGINTLMGPMSFMGQCSTGGTTFKGRCFTFDSGADGYQRGEGCSATFMQMRDVDKTDINRLGVVIGSFVNQDGRSASLTAPNGPSQSALLKAAMRMAGLSPPEVTCCECHGTGTALGDPIEIGALQNVLSQRSRAVLKTSAKSNMAHLEASAGMAGFAKCIMMILAAATPPNVHLKSLNPHLMVEGYPVFFSTELTPWGQNSGYCGVSSFGIGGTNARGEVLGRCQRGPQATPHGLSRTMIEKAEVVCFACPRCLGPMSWVDGAAVPKPIVHEGKYKPSLIRDELADYSVCSKCYTGNFIMGQELEEVGNPDYGVYIRGSWDAFEGMEEMQETRTGFYEFHVALGETRSERFHLLLDKAPEFTIYPARGEAGEHVRLQGPDNEGRGKYWLIDGRDDEVPAGTIYKISFEWSRSRRSISWTQVPLHEAPEHVAGRGFQHRYSVIGSWLSWSALPMRRSTTSQGSLCEIAFQFGANGTEKFHFVRDKDPAQTIYPGVTPDLRGSEGSAVTSPTIKVRGPDAHGRGKFWVVHGMENETATIMLHIQDAHMTVSVSSRSMGRRSWESIEGWARHRYCLTGLFNGWRMEDMEQSGSFPGIFVRRVVVAEDPWPLEFQLAADADPKRLMYPQAAAAGSGQGFLEHLEEATEGDAARGKHWAIQGVPGATYDIMLNLTELDRRKMVTWSQVDV